MLKFLASAVVFLVIGGAVGRFYLAPAPPPVAPTRKTKSSDQVLLNWSMASAYPSGLPIYGTLGKRLTEQLRTVSGGAITFSFVEPGKGNPPGSCFKALKSGKRKVCWGSPIYWYKHERSLVLFGGAPFGPGARELVAWYGFGGGEELLNEVYARHGMKSILCGVAPADAGGWFRKQITNVESLNGMRMRISGVGARVLEKLGVATRHLNGDQIINALRTGQIDAAEYSMPAIDVGVGFHKLVNNYYFPGWHQQAVFLELLISLPVWKGLPETSRATIRAVCGDNFRHGLAEGAAIQASALRELRAKGVTIRTWPPEVLKALRKAWTAVLKEEIAVDPTFKKVWDSLTSFRAEYATWKRIGDLP
jgi:TRAP-type mannitol/chloroaromatic compound transport system substrate-binding protein